MTRTNLLNVSTGPARHVAPAHPTAAPSRPSSNNAETVAADLSPVSRGEMDPCPQHPGERATVHDLVAAYRTAREFGVRLLDVTQADVHLNPGDATSAYMQWLADPANFAAVLAEQGCFDEQVGVVVNEGRERQLEAENERLSAALRTLHARRATWTKHYSGGVRTVGRSICGVTAEALGIEVDHAG